MSYDPNLPTFEPGTVWLTGAGPGDPGLLTLLATKALAEADIVLYDALVNDEILSWTKPDAHLEFVGKRARVKSLKQPEITAKMVGHAKAGKRVLRLKGGDPFIFGRGGEEAIELAKAQIHFRIIPGITAGIGGLAYASIPVTHRDINNVVSFVTGHDSSGSLPVNIDWEALSTASPVIVFYMALRTMPEIAQHLIKAGKSPNTPIAIVSSASSAQQETIEATLGTYEQALQSRTTGAPAIIIVGESVKIRGLLKGWQQTISSSLDQNGSNEVSKLKASLSLAEADDFFEM